MPPEGDRDSRAADARPGQLGAAPRGVGHSMTGREQAVREDPDPEEPEEPIEEIEEVPFRRNLAVAIAGFAGLLAVGLILGSSTSGPDARAPYALVVFGAQVIFVLAWTMALRPPATRTLAAVSVGTAAVADVLAVNIGVPSAAPLGLVLLAGCLLAVLGQTLRAADRARLKNSLFSTLVVVAGATSFALLVLLTRKPAGTQAIAVGLAATGVALVVARLTDVVFARPRVAAQVPRGATGIVVGAMLGTLAAAGLGSAMLPFTPGRAAVLGLVAAVSAGLIDLAVDYAEAVRGTAGGAPTLWVARHMQGPLGAFAFGVPVAYVTAVLFPG